MMAILSRMLLLTTPPAVDPGVSGEMYNQAVVALATAIPSMVNPRATSGAKMRGCVTAVGFMTWLCLVLVARWLLLFWVVDGGRSNPRFEINGEGLSLCFAVVGSGDAVGVADAVGAG